MDDPPGIGCLRSRYSRWWNIAQAGLCPNGTSFRQKLVTSMRLPQEDAFTCCVFRHSSIADKNQLGLRVNSLANPIQKKQVVA